MFWLLCLQIVAAVVCVVFIRKHWENNVSAKASLNSLPLLAFEDDNTAENYITNTPKLMRIGYERYLKYGQSFLIRNPADEARPQVIMAQKYLDEVKSAPLDQLSFPLFSRQAFLLDHSGSPQQSESAVHIVRVDLNRNLGNLIPVIHEEIKFSMDKQLNFGKDWTPLKIYMPFTYIVACTTARVLVGQELSRNDEWIKISTAITINIHHAAQSIRAKYSPRWRWLAKWFHTESKAVAKARIRGKELLAPIYRTRLQSGPGGGEVHKQMYRDGVRWLLDSPRHQKPSPDQIADEELFLSVASIHSTSATLVSILYDWLSHPEYYDEIKNEIRSEVAENKGVWSVPSLGRLHKLDSFMKESQRMHAIGLITVQRTAVKPYTFKDGLRIPANTQLSFPNAEFGMNDQKFESPASFDAYRFLNYRQGTEVSNKFSFASVSNDSIGFGAGVHACPGRFFVSAEIKLVLIELLTQFDMKLDEGPTRPPNTTYDFSSIPNMTADVLFRRKPKQGL